MGNTATILGFMLNVGSSELLIIFLVALIFLGPTRLPQVARQVGQTVSSLRSLATGFQAELKAASQPDRYDGPMHLSGPVDDNADGGSDADAAIETSEVIQTPEPTDTSELARAAREVDVDAASVPEVSAGGPSEALPGVAESDEEE